MHFMCFRPLEICQLSATTSYITNLRTSQRLVPLCLPNVYACADKKPDGSLRNADWVLITPEVFYVETSPSSKEILYKCSCKAADSHRIFLESVRSSVSSAKALELFCSEQKLKYCDHVKAMLVILDLTPSKLENVQTEQQVEILTMTYFTAAVNSKELGIGLVKAGRSPYVTCITCPWGGSGGLSDRKGCDHEVIFDRYDDESQILNLARVEWGKREPNYKLVTTSAIPWPPTAQQKRTRVRYLRTGHPEKLQPEKPEGRCDHGHPYVLQLDNDNAKIHKQEAVLDGYHIYSYVTKQSCGCSVTYQGLSDMLVNVDGDNLICLWWLFSIFQHSKETRYPLRSAHRAMMKSRLSNEATPFDLLYRGYNGFLRYVS